MQKNLAPIAKYFKKIYKPTNNNLRTSSKSRNKNLDTTLWFKNDNQSGQFGNQRMMNVSEARENVGSPVVQQSGIQCFNCKEFDTDEEIDEQELEAHYSYMAEIQEVPTVDTGTDSEPLEQVQNDTGYNVFANDLQHSEQSKSISNICIVETDDSNFIPDSPDICDDVIQNDQNDVESDDEHVALDNLKLNVDENKKIQKQLKKANTTLAQELKECKTILTEFQMYKAFNDHTMDYDKLERYSTQSKGYHVYDKRTRLIVESIHIRFDEIKEMSETSFANDTSGLVPQRQKALDYDKSDPVPQLQNVSSSVDAHVPSQQELDLLFGPLYDEFFTAGTSSVNKSSSPTNNSNQQDTQPTTNIQP
nr:hypothetical protein [Tanacetum cinerariifolium]